MSEFSNLNGFIVKDAEARELFSKNNPYMSYFNGKSVCVIGDSMSDETTNAPNWVATFREKVESWGGSVTNISTNGNSFAGYAQDGGLNNLIVADIYVLFLGINDFQGQWAWNKPIAEYGLYDSVHKVMRTIAAKNPNADYFYISPIKTLRAESQNYERPLIWYRSFYEKVALRHGFTVISGYNAPRLSTSNPQYLSDTLHPTSAYGKILADYFINAIVSRVSTLTPQSTLLRDLTTHIGDGFAKIIFNSDITAKILVVLNSSVLSIGWNDVATVPAILSEYMQTSNHINNGDGNAFMSRIEGNKLQIYSFTEQTVNLDFGFDWRSYIIDETINI